MRRIEQGTISGSRIDRIEVDTAYAALSRDPSFTLRESDRLRRLHELATSLEEAGGGGASRLLSSG
ncbi:MAG: hypothetical protein M3121_00910 [Chloroflexota bacterium]|nr:hypothetical protein [Chloroflexota bacterium]